eukprot:scaffold38088_cov35-Attheya_sp.AAC.3
MESTSKRRAPTTTKPNPYTPYWWRALGSVYGASDGIGEPPENYLCGLPCTITFEQFFDRDGVFPMLGIQLVRRPEDVVNRMA